jgi:hypothetical protein
LPDPDLQAIGWALLLAGGVSLLADAMKQTRDLDTELGQWLALHLVNLCGVLFARFYIFPTAGYKLMKTCIEEQPQWLAAVSGLGLACMTIFNVVVLAIMSEKLARNGFAFAKQRCSRRQPVDLKQE